MSLMNHAIRPKLDFDEEDIYAEDAYKVDNNNLKKIMSDFREAFSKQSSLMRAEIGCYFPVSGHRILLKAIILPEKTKGGLYLTEQARDDYAVVYDIGLVIGMGPEAYMDKERFPLGPRCKVGDWIDFSPFEKQKKKYNDYLCYIINDDRVNFPIPDIVTVVKELR